MSSHRMSVEAIASLLGAKPSPAGPAKEQLITRVSSFEGADQNSLVFAEQHQSYLEALASPAGLILVSAELASDLRPPEDRRVLAVDNVRYAFARCARALFRAEGSQEGGRIHPRASVDDTAILGQRVTVHAGAVVGPLARLGDDVVIGANAVIAEGVQVGHRVVVQSGAVLGSTGFGYVRDHTSGNYLLFPQQGALVIEDDVEIGANSTIDRGALEETRIGAGTKIDNLVHIGHNCRIGKNVIIAAQVGISGSCVVEDGAILAGQVGLSDHCHIGSGVILGGQAGVYRGKTVNGPGEVFSGTPAEPLKAQMRSLARLRRLR